MTQSEPRIPLPGSERATPPGSRLMTAHAADEHIEVTVVLKPRAGATHPAALAARPLHERQPLSRAEFAATRGADPAAIALVEKFASEHGLDVVEADPARRSVVLSGTISAISNAFGTSVDNYELNGVTYRGRSGPLLLPASLVSVVQAVLGIDNRPQAKPHFRILPEPERMAAAAPSSYTPLQIAQAYNFPANTDGKGQTIAIIELGGGYRMTDINNYFAKLGIPTPSVVSVSVDHGRNRPTGNPNGPDGEVDLDIEVAGAVAPGANIVVYFAPNTDQGFHDAVTKATHDTVHNPSVISISWGGPESAWTQQAIQAFDQALQDAATLGVTVCCASGDDGSNDGTTDGLAHVDFPASSPYALGCGGTKLQANGATITSEVVWNEEPNHGATGGGVSDVFPLPTWQQDAHVPPSVNPGGHVGRGVPDVAGDADPLTGYQVLVDGKSAVIGGTSAVAPLWAGLIARLNQSLGKPVGYLNPVIYALSANSGAFNDITSGNNIGYQAGPGWDACTGWGSPNGAQLLQALKKS